MARERLRLLSYMVGGFPLSLFERIASVLDAELDVDEERSGPAPGDDPFADGRADLGWICSTSFVAMSTQSTQPTQRASGGPEAPSIRLAGVAWVPDDPASGGRPVYFGDVLSRQPRAGLADLAGSRVGCNDAISLSGHLAFRHALRGLGEDPDRFVDLCFTGGHRNSLQALLDGELDAATIDSVVRAQVTREDPRVGALHLVERLGPWPTQPLVASTRLPREQVDELRDALLASNRDPAMRAELRAASLERFVEVGPDHYRRVHEAIAHS